MSELFVKGLRETDAFLSAFPKNMQKAGYRAGLTASAAVVRKRAKELAPRRTGKMARAIRSGSARANRDGTFSIRVYVDERKEHGFLGYFLEYGVNPHLISVNDYDRPAYQARDGRTRQRSIRFLNQQVTGGSLSISGSFVGPVVEHPGHAAHPFMRPALEETADEATKAFAERIRAFIEGKTGFVQEAA